MRGRLLVTTLGLLSAATLGAQATPASNAKARLHWAAAPAVFPAGARMAVVSGDPSKAAPFTVALSFPGGYRIPPHFHPTDEHVVVKKGALLVGMGDTLDAARTKRLTPGQSGDVPANAHHYAIARGATTVQVSAMGPFALTYVNPADDPTKRATP